MEDHVSLIVSHFLLNFDLTASASAFLGLFTACGSMFYWIYSETATSVGTVEKKTAGKASCDPASTMGKGNVSVGGTVINEEMLGQMELLFNTLQQQQQRSCDQKVGLCKGEMINLKDPTLGQPPQYAAVGIPTAGGPHNGMPMMAIPVNTTTSCQPLKSNLDCQPLKSNLDYLQEGKMMPCDIDSIKPEMKMKNTSRQCESTAMECEKGDAKDAVARNMLITDKENTKTEDTEEEEIVCVTKDKFHLATCRYAKPKAGVKPRLVPKKMAIDVLQCTACKVCCK